MIFVDTSVWVALVNRRDDRHRLARTLFERSSTRQLTTSTIVRGESWTFLRRRAGHAVAVGFLDLLERSRQVRLERIEPDVEADALAWLRRHDERPYSFVDATSFALMRSLRIRTVLTYDEGFEAAGFDIVRA